MKFLLPLAGALLVLGVAVVATRGDSAPSEAAPRPAAPKTEGAATAEPVTVKAPPSYSAAAASQIAARLEDLRTREEARRVAGVKPTAEEAKEEAARRADIAALGESLKDFLIAHPETWPDVFAQLSKLDSLMSMLELSVMLSAGVDPAFEPQLIRALRENAERMARRAAVALLADSPTVEALQAFIETAQMDHDSAVRYAAFLQMVRRKAAPEFQSYAPVIEDTVRRLATVEPDITVRGLMSRWLPGNAPPTPEYKPRSKGGPRTPKKPK